MSIAEAINNEFGTLFTFQQAKAQWRYHQNQAKNFADDQAKTGRGRKTRPAFLDEVHSIMQESHTFNLQQLSSSLVTRTQSNPFQRNYPPPIEATSSQIHQSQFLSDFDPLNEDEILPNITSPAANVASSTKKRSPIQEFQNFNAL